MSDQGFREVQLSGKQVVFLFMALAVILVGAFLLGVSVGRHVEPETASAQATPTSTAIASDADSTKPMPPATTTVPGDLTYSGTLKGKAEPAVPAPSPSATASDALKTEPPAQTPAPAPKETPAAKAATPPTAPPPANDTWYVQVDSFSSSSNASTRVSDLKAKGITAKTVKSGSLYQVRVGPFDHPGAEAMQARLRKLGYKPRVIR